MDIKSLIRDVPDFPIPGILFRDMSPLLKNPMALDFVSRELVKNVDLSNVDLFAGIESRGFILASHMAAVHKKGFLPIRKAGKLPPPTVKVSYSLEYGQAEIELPLGNERIIIVDDVLATGGTLSAALLLAEKAGYQVIDAMVLINLTFLNQLDLNGQKIKSLIQY